MKPSGRSYAAARARAGQAPAVGRARRARSRAAPAAASNLAGRRLLTWMIVAVVAWACLGWLFQPWSHYSPLRMLVAALDPRGRVETLQGFDEVFPHRSVIARADAEPLPRREAPLDALYDWNGERKLVESFLEEASVTGLLVVNEGAIVHERYRLGASAESRFSTFSLAKGVIATLVGMAVQDGLIASIDDPLETYAPAYRGSDLGATSLRDLLAMAAGTDFDESFGSPGSDIVGLYVQTLVLGADPDRVAARARRTRPPGEALDFSSANTQALAAAVAAVYRQPLAQVVEEKLWGPVGMTADASWSQSREGTAGVALGFCCLNATLQDIARFGELMRRNGVWARTRLLPDGWIDVLATPSSFAQPPEDAADETAGDARRDEALGPWGYGLHVFVPPGGQGQILLAGEYGQYLWIDRRRKTVVAMTAADGGWRDRRAEATVVLRQIVAKVADEG